MKRSMDGSVERLIAIIALLFMSLTISGCVTTGRLYNLDSGIVIHTKFQNYGTGHGNISAITPDGENLEGEYSTISGMSMGSGFAGSSGSYGWAQAYGFSFYQPGMQFGTATLVGDKGTAIEIVYAVDPWTSHGYGVGRDNKGNRYRLQF